MAAYYNEIDPFAAAWLRELIARSLIAPGDVDERSIEVVQPDEVRAYTQCHFFAGIGVWSYALRRAGWDDARPVWTGSCPCQPFSPAGKGKGFNDKRHLWPHLYRLIRECRPDVCFGEQTSSPAGRTWLDLVSADLEGIGYACGAVDLCAAGVGAPHIRQRLYWVAESEGVRSVQRGRGHRDRSARATTRSYEGGREAMVGVYGTSGGGAARGLGNADEARPQGHGRPVQVGNPEGRETAERHGASPSMAGGVADADGGNTGAEREQCGGEHRLVAENGVSGFWRDADWIHCAPEPGYPEGRWRPVEPGTFPLVDGAPARLGRISGYGNAIVAPVAKAFIEAYLDVEGGLTT